MKGKGAARHVSLFTDYDTHLFKQGNHFRLYEKLGSHAMTVDGVEGTFFAVWAPNAQKVSVIGDFNAWENGSDPLQVREDGSGIWEGFIPGASAGALYKYHITSRYDHYEVNKGDPYAFRWETPPQKASIVWDLQYTWGDHAWMARRARSNRLGAPLAIYEVHLGSWRRVPEAGNRFLTYRELAHPLAAYLLEMGFTHVELMPITEHPFYGSWGYQTNGYFAPTSRYGTPQDFMCLVDTLHQHGIGVILDWVPSHFPSDEHGLVYFDGTHLYEHADPQKGFHPDWNSYIFNYGRNEVKNFLISSACFWLEKYHIDGLRVDAVASMLYLDYGRREGEWIPNEYGGRENIEAISMLKRLNETLYGHFPDTQTMAEESTAWPMVTRPVHVGGLGFGMKWNMGWMHDTLDYWSKDPIYRKYHHDRVTFSIWYAFTENFLLPLSHDEVVHGKGSLIGKMPGDEWQRFANLRLLFGYMYGHPGKKLLFMGGEWGQWREWDHEKSLEWHLLESPSHQRLQRWVRDLNRFYRDEPAMYEADHESSGFEWIDYQDWEQGVLSFIRRGKTTDTVVLVVCNTTPVTRRHYRIGVPNRGFWREALNSDAEIYGGSGVGNMGDVEATDAPAHGHPSSLSLSLPPLGVLYLKSREHIQMKEIGEDLTSYRQTDHEGPSLKHRASGILLHITSLPSPYGIGDLGVGAYRFADFLAATKQRFWQILPLAPTTPFHGNSPYSSHSALAGNPLLISPDLLVEKGLLAKKDIQPVPSFPEERVDYAAVTAYKAELLEKAYHRHKDRINTDEEFKRFCGENVNWLEDYALFVALKAHFKEISWDRWPVEFRDRRNKTIENCRAELGDRIVQEKFIQYLLFRQWADLKQYCNRKRIKIIGDLPIYVDYDSTDVWVHPELFKLDTEKRPLVFAGVPPDFFSATGQLWGNPVYRWDILKTSGYAWWIERVGYHLERFDLVRLDHFRGFVDYWEIPAGEKTAVNGRWVPCPGEEFFRTLLRSYSSLPFIAEDLGIITADVGALRDRFAFPGMRILQFAFEDDPLSDLYQPHHYIHNCVAYTGTHDNATLVSWLFDEDDCSRRKPEEFITQRENAMRYIGLQGEATRDIYWEFIRLMMESVANLVIFPMQDVLGLGKEGRMNRPATPHGNWEWRLRPKQLEGAEGKRLAEMTQLSGRM